MINLDHYAMKLKKFVEDFQTPDTKDCAFLCTWKADNDMCPTLVFEDGHVLDQVQPVHCEEKMAQTESQTFEF